MDKNKVIPEETDIKDKISDFKFIQFSRFRNGFLAKWIYNCFKSKTGLISSFTYNEISILMFMFVILFRTTRILTSSSPDKRFLIFYGSLWHYMGGNRVHSEIMVFLWTLNFFVIYLFVIHCPNKHYKWLEIYVFLAQIIPHKRIGIYF